MKIENIRIALVERNPWQAIDMGFNIARQFYLPLLKSYLLGFGIICLPLIAVLYYYPFWAALLIWYLKPLFEVGPQLILSRLIFSEEFSNRQIAHITFNAMKKYFWLALFHLRLSIRRSFIMPVYLLEQLPSEPRKKRLKMLSLGQSQGPVSLTVLLSHAEMLFYLVILFIVYQFIPEYERANPFILLQQEKTDLAIEWFSITSWLIAMIAVAPFYVCGGFALYLNKRIELEGWDIELSFKKIKNRLKNSITVAGSLLLFLFFISAPHQLLAVESDSHTKTIPPQSENLKKEKKEQKIPEINRKTKEEIQYILHHKPLEFIPEQSQWKISSSDSKSSANLSWLAATFEIFLWGAVILLILWLLSKIPNLKHTLTPIEKREKIIRKANVFGMKLTSNELNMDLLTALNTALLDSHFRKVLALLLSSALGELAQMGNKKIPRGATEADCLMIAKKFSPETQWFSWFEQLIQYWSALAWGHKPVTKAQLETLITQAPLKELSDSHRDENNVPA